MGKHRTIGFLSDLTYRVFVGAALVEPLIGREKRSRHALHRMGTLCAGLLASSLVKRLVPETRPDGSDNKSFPSGHSVATMAVARTAAAQQPERAGLWYGGAVLETVLRALSRKHHLHDVVAGGAVGYLIARYGGKLLASRKETEGAAGSRHAQRTPKIGEAQEHEHVGA